VTGRLGKPHPEQGRVGDAPAAATRPRRLARPSPLVDRTRPAATSVPDGWPPPRAPPGYRSRLTGRLPLHHRLDLRIGAIAALRVYMWRTFPGPSRLLAGRASRRRGTRAQAYHAGRSTLLLPASFTWRRCRCTVVSSTRPHSPRRRCRCWWPTCSTWEAGFGHTGNRDRSRTGWNPWPYRWTLPSSRPVLSPTTPPAGGAVASPQPAPPV
jgi:hypothetical protein